MPERVQLRRACGQCGYWGRVPPGARFAFCFAPKRDRPLWTETLYPAPGYPNGKVLEQSPSMPFTDGEGCRTWKPRPLLANQPLEGPRDG